MPSDTKQPATPSVSVCQHKWVELSISECAARKIPHCGRCWHVYECRACGEQKSYDTSD